MPDFRMNKNKPIGAKNLTTVAGYTAMRRSKPPAPKEEPKVPEFDVVMPDGNDIEVRMEGELPTQVEITETDVHPDSAMGVALQAGVLSGDILSTAEVEELADDGPTDDSGSTGVDGGVEVSEGCDQGSEGDGDEDVGCEDNVEVHAGNDDSNVEDGEELQDSSSKAEAVPSDEEVSLPESDEETDSEEQTEEELTNEDDEESDEESE